jgi:hypothetical protein
MQHHPDPDPEHTAAIIQGVERAIARLLGDSGDSSDFYAAIRLGVRDALWLIAANAEGTERPSGHAD